MKLTGKRTLSWLLALAMLVTLLPAVVLTSSAADPVARVGSTEYSTLDEAISNWTSGTLTLLADALNVADYKFTAQSGQSLTLDLNGHRVTGGAPVLLYGGNLTVKDSSNPQAGSIVGSSVSVYCFAGSFTLEGGTVGSDTSAMSIYAQTDYPMSIALNGGTVLCGSTLTTSQALGSCAVYCNGAAVDLTVNGASVGSETAGQAIHIINANTVSIEGGTVKSVGTTLLANGGDVSISGGRVEHVAADAKFALQVSGSAHCTVSSGEIVSAGNGVYVGDFANPPQGDKQLIMTGGSIDADGIGIMSNGNTPENITIDLSGGSIHGDGAALYSPNPNETVYISGTAALSGNTGVAVKGGTVVISGGTITATGPKTDAAANLSGFTNTGDAIYVEDNYPDHNPTVIISDGTIESGNGYALQYYTDETDATVATGYIEASGGTFSSKQATSELNSSGLDDKIILSGGTYDKEPDPANIEPGSVAIQNDQGKWVIGESFFKGYSLSLKGDVAVNFYVDLGTLDPADVTVEYTTTNVNGSTLAATAFSALSTDAATGWYKFSVPFAAKEMTDTVTVTLKKNGTQLEQKIYSVAKYASRVSLNEGGEFDSLAHITELRELCRTMLIYGAKAQAQFAYKTTELADAALSAADKTLVPVDVDSLPDYPTGVDLSAFGVTFADSSLLLETKTTHRLYFTVQDVGLLNAATVTCGSKTLTAVVSGNTAYVDIPEIAARNVLKNYTVTFTNGTDTAKLRVNAGSYIKNALAGSDETLKDTVTALYWYSTAAEAYFTAS